ncbi:MAG TPA: VTT domain-containing protein, partial [Bdellovibrionota bacterium]|nr:VTT domain-containing protein [Bdellovibrionota bacterium]
GKGVLGYQETLVVSFVSVMVADLFLYHLGKYGALIPPISKILTPKRIKRMERYFKKYGSLTIFVAAFIPGVRATAFVMSGIVKINRWVFIFWDSLGAGIYISLLLILVSKAHAALPDLIKSSKEIELMVIIGIGVLAVYFIISQIVRLRRKPK